MGAGSTDACVSAVYGALYCLRIWCLRIWCLDQSVSIYPHMRYFLCGLPIIQDLRGALGGGL